MAEAGGWGKLLNDRPPNSVLLEAQRFVSDRLTKKWLPLFLSTTEFADRSQPKTGMDDVVDDVIVQKRKKSQAVQKVIIHNYSQIHVQTTGICGRVIVLGYQ